ncbi:hypothetical protein C8R47DRAFT_1068556 [Mycena vitilis]|nr:hypothetical protein C8R47DRAFT_1068556 [Mycena vitilis]
MCHTPRHSGTSEDPADDDERRRRHTETQRRYRARNLAETRKKARLRMERLRAATELSDEAVALAAARRRPVDADYREQRRKKYIPRSSVNIFQVSNFHWATRKWENSAASTGQGTRLTPRRRPGHRLRQAKAIASDKHRAKADHRAGYRINQCQAKAGHRISRCPHDPSQQVFSPPSPPLLMLASTNQGEPSGPPSEIIILANALRWASVAGTDPNSPYVVANRDFVITEEEPTDHACWEYVGQDGVVRRQRRGMPDRLRAGLEYARAFQ